MNKSVVLPCFLFTLLGNGRYPLKDQVLLLPPNFKDLVGWKPLFWWEKQYISREITNSKTGNDLIRLES